MRGSGGGLGGGAGEAGWGYAGCMEARNVTPILNVSDVTASIAWFERFGWRKCWDWREDPSGPAAFGSVGSGHCEIFLCRDGQGSRGRGGSPTTRTDQQGDKGVWMSVWVADVDEEYQKCLKQGLEVTMSPTDEPWGVREMHVRHPDGHVFRVSKGGRAISDQVGEFRA